MKLRTITIRSCIFLGVVLFIAVRPVAGHGTDVTTDRGTTEAEERRAIDYFNRRGALLSQHFSEDAGGNVTVDGKTLRLCHEEYGDADLAHLPRLSDIRRVELSGADVTDKGLQVLATVAGITELSLDSTPISDVGVENLKPLRHLHFLDLSSTKITEKSLQVLSGFPELEEIRVCRNTAITAIALDKRFAALKSIDVSRCPLRSVRIVGVPRLQSAEFQGDCGSLLHTVQLEDLPAITTVRIVWFSPSVGESPKERECKLLFKALPSLETLTLQTRIRSNDLRAFRDMPKLQVLDFRGSEIIGRLSEHLRGLQWIRELDLSEMPLDKEDSQFLSNLTNLRTLRLGDCHIDGRALLPLAKLTYLETLDFGGNSPVSDEHLQHLSNLTNLKSLELRSCDIDGKMLRHLARLKNLENLSLLGNTAVRDDGLRHLADLTRLQSLCLSDCMLTGEGFAHFGKLQKLAELDLSRNPLTKIAVSYLQHLKGLRGLDLQYATVTGEWIDAFGSMTFLERIDLSSGRLDRNELNRLKKRLPNTSVSELRD